MKRLLFDGAKSANLDSLPAEAWTIISGRTPGSDDVVEVVRTVPILQRAVTLVSDAVGSMPFAIMRGSTEIDISAEYKNALGILPNLPSMLSLIETSILMWGAGYWFIGRNRGRRAKEVRYLAPTTIRPIIEPGEGLKGFTRIIGSTQIELTVDEVVYFWLPDPSIEVGPPSWSPVKAALRAAGVLGSMDKFTTNFFDRGAIKATLLTVPATTRKADRETLRSWWRTVFGGVKNAFATEVINADDVKPVVIGEGIESLSNAELTREKREDIAVALGIPYSLLFPDAANFATAQQDDRHFYQKTIIPACTTIANVINQQLLESFGCVLEFRPEGLDAMQEDEGNRASAFAAYVGAGLKPSLVAQLLGLELPKGVDYDDLDPEEPEPQPAQPGQPPLPEQPQEEPEPEEKPAVKYDPDQPRDEIGRWTDGGGGNNTESESDLHTMVDYKGSQMTAWYAKKLSWLDSFSEDERYAFYSWQRSGADLRRQQSGEETPEQNPTAAQVLPHWESIMERGYRYEGVVHRGLNSVPRNVVSDWEPGTIIELKNDQSASKSLNYVEDRFQVRPDGGTVNVVWSVNQRSGISLFDMPVDYGGIGRNEKEVVLRRNTRYRVIEKTRNKEGNGYIIRLDEL